jgi:HPt (histidine-containing phosphotransfer) domain-containing protein
MSTVNPIIEKNRPEINIDSEEAIDNFGNEIFEQTIILFVDESYKTFKEGIIKAQEEKDKNKMKILTHTLKTTARYMASENFALQCQALESESKNPDWEKIDNLLINFYKDIDILYNKCMKYYNEYKNVNKLDNINIENAEEKCKIKIIKIIKL